MIEERVKKKIIDICTHHGEEGTSSFALTDKQFTELFAFIDDYQRNVRKDCSFELERKYNKAIIKLREELF